jgi:hypothetical protein
MLTHFYAVASILIGYAKKQLSIEHLDYLWSYFQITGLLFFADTETKNIFYLALAPAFPFLLSLFVGISLWWSVKNDIESRLTRFFSLLLPPLAHFIVLYSMTWQPFNKFIDILS